MNWSRRYKANLEKLASGDVNKVAEVVRDLWRRDRERGLSAGEKRMLAKARQILVSELALAGKTNEDKAEALLDEVLANLLRSRASGPGGVWARRRRRPGQQGRPSETAHGRPGHRRPPPGPFPGPASGWAVVSGAARPRPLPRRRTGRR